MFTNNKNENVNKNEDENENENGNDNDKDSNHHHHQLNTHPLKSQSPRAVNLRAILTLITLYDLLICKALL